MKRELFYIIPFSVLTLLFTFSSSIQAADITLAWDSNQEENIGGYKLYYKTGTSGPPYNGTDAYQGPSPIDIPVTELGNPSYPEYTLTNLKDDETYFFAVTAYSNQTSDRESGFSNEVSNADNGPIDVESESSGGGCFISSLKQ